MILFWAAFIQVIRNICFMLLVYLARDLPALHLLSLGNHSVKALLHMLTTSCQLPRPTQLESQDLDTCVLDLGALRSFRCS